MFVVRIRWKSYTLTQTPVQRRLLYVWLPENYAEADTMHHKRSIILVKPKKNSSIPSQRKLIYTQTHTSYIRTKARTNEHTKYLLVRVHTRCHNPIEILTVLLATWLSRPFQLIELTFMPLDCCCFRFWFFPCSFPVFPTTQHLKRKNKRHSTSFDRIMLMA